MNVDLCKWYMDVYAAVNKIDPHVLSKAIRMVEFEGEEE